MTIITNRSETNYKNFIAFTELSMVLILNQKLLIEGSLLRQKKQVNMILLDIHEQIIF